MKALVVALFALLVGIRHAIHRDHIPRSGNPQRTAEEAAKWAAAFARMRNGGLI